MHKLLKSCQCNLSGSGIFITEIKLCEEAATGDQGPDDVHAGPTAKAKVSDCMGWITEIKGSDGDAYKARQISCLCQSGQITGGLGRSAIP